MSPPDRHGKTSAFSLMEVVVATAVFAGSIVAVLGLLGPSLQTTREVIDTAVAARLADGVDQELRRFVAASSFGALVTATGLDDGIEIYATADGSTMVEVTDWASLTDDDPRKIPAGERYFLLSVEQLDEPASSPEFAALGIEVEWPFETPSGETSETERKWFTFNTAMRP